MKLRLTCLIALLSTAPGWAGDFVVAPPTPPFEDVEMEHWAYDAVDSLREKGMLEGWGERFHGRRTFTRYEMAEILARYTQKLEEAQGGSGSQMGIEPGSAEVSPTRRTLEEKVEALRRRRRGSDPSLFSRLVRQGGVEQLEKQVERIAAMVATHQVLLEEPESQPAWRTRLGTRSTRTGSHGPGLYSPPPPPPPPDPRSVELLEELDRLSKGVEDRSLRPSVPTLSSRERLQIALTSMGSDPATASEEAQESRKEAFGDRLELARSLRTAGSPEFLSPPSEPSLTPREREQDLRLLQALEAIKRGELDPERARAVAYLAELALARSTP